MRVKSQSVQLHGEKRTYPAKKLQKEGNMGWQEQRACVSVWNLRVQNINVVSEEISIMDVISYNKALIARTPGYRAKTPRREKPTTPGYRAKMAVGSLK